MKIKVHMSPVSEIIRKKGLGRDGAVQMFHTQNVLRRIKKYMPFLSGATYKLTVAQTDIRKPEIITDVPYGKYLFYGKRMVNAKTGRGPVLIPGVGYRYPRGAVLKVTEKDLEYTRSKNPMAGPRWDRALSSAEGKAMAADLQRFVDRR